MTRAIVEGKLDNHHYRVRIPTYNKVGTAIGATPTIELAVATVATPPGVAPSFVSGDVVFVDFEEDDTAKPVIVGRLFNDRSDKIVSDFSAASLVVDVNARFSEDTTIGEVEAENLKHLKGLNSNVQYTFDENSTEHNKLAKQSKDYYEQLSKNLSDVEHNFNTSIKDIQDVNKQQSNQITKLNNITTSIENKLKGPLILNNISYGTAAPATIKNPKEGQLYLHIE